MLDVWRAATLAQDASCVEELYAVLVSGLHIGRPYNTNRCQPKELGLNIDGLTMLVTKAQRAASILAALVSLQEVFNGYGQHTAMDLLHNMAIWPGMPPRDLCSDAEMYGTLRACLSAYASQYVSREYRTRCLPA